MIDVRLYIFCFLSMNKVYICVVIREPRLSVFVFVPSKGFGFKSQLDFIFLLLIYRFLAAC